MVPARKHVPSQFTDCCKCLEGPIDPDRLQKWLHINGTLLQRFVEFFREQPVQWPNSRCVLDEYCLPRLLAAALHVVLDNIFVPLGGCIELDVAAANAVVQLVQASTMCWLLTIADVKSTMSQNRTAGASAAVELLKQVLDADMANTLGLTMKQLAPRRASANTGAYMLKAAVQSARYNPGNFTDSTNSILDILPNVVVGHWDALVQHWPGNWLSSRLAEHTCTWAPSLAAALVLFCPTHTRQTADAASSSGSNRPCRSTSGNGPAAISSSSSSSNSTTLKSADSSVHHYLSGLAIACRLAALLHEATQSQLRSTAPVVQGPPAAAAAAAGNGSGSMYGLLPDYEGLLFAPAVERLLKDPELIPALLFAITVVTYHPSASCSTNNIDGNIKYSSPGYMLANKLTVPEAAIQQVLQHSGMLQQQFVDLLLPLLSAVALAMHRREKRFKQQLRDWKESTTGSSSSSNSAGRPQMHTHPYHVDMLQPFVVTLLLLLDHIPAAAEPSQRQQLTLLMAANIRAVLYELAEASASPKIVKAIGVIAIDPLAIGLLEQLPKLQQCQRTLEAHCSSSSSSSSSSQDVAAAQELLCVFADAIVNLHQVVDTESSSEKAETSSPQNPADAAGAHDAAGLRANTGADDSERKQQQQQQAVSVPVYYPAVQRKLPVILSLLETALRHELHSQQQQQPTTTSSSSTQRHTIFNAVGMLLLPSAQLQQEVAAAAAAADEAAGVQLRLVQRWLASNCTAGSSVASSAAVACTFVSGANWSRLLQLQQQKVAAQQDDKSQSAHVVLCLPLPPQQQQKQQQQQQQQQRTQQQQKTLECCRPCQPGICEAETAAVQETATAVAWFRLGCCLLKFVWSEVNAATNMHSGSCSSSNDMTSEAKVSSSTSLELSNQLQQELLWMQLMVQLECQKQMIQDHEQQLQDRAAAFLNSTSSSSSSSGSITSNASEVMASLSSLLLWPLLAARCCYVAGAWLQQTYSDLLQQQQQQWQEGCQVTDVAAGVAADQQLQPQLSLLNVVDMLPTVLQLMGFIPSLLLNSKHSSTPAWFRSLQGMMDGLQPQLQQLLEQHKDVACKQLPLLCRLQMQQAAQCEQMTQKGHELTNEMGRLSKHIERLAVVDNNKSGHAGQHKKERSQSRLQGTYQQMEQLHQHVTDHLLEIQHMCQQQYTQEDTRRVSAGHIMNCRNLLKGLEILLRQQKPIADLSQRRQGVHGAATDRHETVRAVPKGRAVGTMSRTSSSGTADGLLAVKLQQVEELINTPGIQFQYSDVVKLGGSMQDVATAVWSLVPQQYCCNNIACSNLSGVSEAAVVSGAACVCSGCGVARYCSRECQKAHWKRHQRVCRALRGNL